MPASPLRIDEWAARRRRSAIEAATAELDLDEADVEELHSFLERTESSSSMSQSLARGGRRGPCPGQAWSAQAQDRA